MAHSSTGYTTNLPLADVTGGKAWVVWEFGGQPLPRQHGGPARLLVPHLYFWKSAKWVSRLELMAEDRPGSGSRTATTTAATRGSSSATRATDREPADHRRRPAGRDRVDDRPDHREGAADADRRSGCGCTSRTGSGTGRASTTWSGSGRPTTTPRSAPTRSPRTTTTRWSSSSSRGFPTARSRSSSPTSPRSATCSRCAGRSALVHLGRPHPALCLVGGTGVVPAVAMTRTARRLGRADLLRVVAVGRTPESCRTPTSSAAPAPARLTRHDTDEPAGRAADRATSSTPLLDGVELAYVCGSARFAAYAESLLLDCGVDRASGWSSSAPPADGQEVRTRYAEGPSVQARTRS